MKIKLDVSELYAQSNNSRKIRELELPVSEHKKTLDKDDTHKSRYDPNFNENEMIIKKINWSSHGRD